MAPRSSILSVHNFLWSLWICREMSLFPLTVGHPFLRNLELTVNRRLNKLNLLEANWRISHSPLAEKTATVLLWLPRESWTKVLVRTLDGVQVSIVCDQQLSAGKKAFMINLEQLQLALIYARFKLAIESCLKGSQLSDKPLPNACIAPSNWLSLSCCFKYATL